MHPDPAGGFGGCAGQRGILTGLGGNRENHGPTEGAIFVLWDVFDTENRILARLWARGENVAISTLGFRCVHAFVSLLYEFIET